MQERLKHDKILQLAMVHSPSVRLLGQSDICTCMTCTSGEEKTSYIFKERNLQSMYGRCLSAPPSYPRYIDTVLWSPSSENGRDQPRDYPPRLSRRDTEGMIHAAFHTVHARVQPREHLSLPTNITGIVNDEVTLDMLAFYGLTVVEHLRSIVRRELTSLEMDLLTRKIPFALYRVYREPGPVPPVAFVGYSTERNEPVITWLPRIGLSVDEFCEWLDRSCKYAKCGVEAIQEMLMECETAAVCRPIIGWGASPHDSRPYVEVGLLDLAGSVRKVYRIYESKNHPETDSGTETFEWGRIEEFFVIDEIIMREYTAR